MASYTDEEMMARQQALAGITDLQALKESWESMRPAHVKPDYAARYAGSSARAQSGKIMESRFNGRCADCGGRILAGDTIRYDGKAHHIDAETCEAERDAQAAAEASAALEGAYDEVEAEWAAMQAATVTPAAPALDVTPAEAATIRDGVYTLVEAGGDYVTIKVHSPKRGNWAGQTIVSYLYGQNNEGDYTAFGVLNGARVKPWYNYRSESRLIRLTEALADPSKAAEAGLAYALMSNNCCRCGRRLTVPASIHMGMGPDCAGKA